MDNAIGTTAVSPDACSCSMQHGAAGHAVLAPGGLGRAPPCTVVCDTFVPLRSHHALKLGQELRIAR